MGYNTGVLILNDAVGAAQKDPQKFAENLLQALSEHSLRPNEPVDFAIGNNVNGGTIFYQQHADITGVVAIGGNCTSELLTTYNGGRHHTPEYQERLLRELADKLGYRLTKKAVRKIATRKATK